MAANRQTYIHTHARAQCSHASVGLAQARPNKPPLSHKRLPEKGSFCMMLKSYPQYMCRERLMGTSPHQLFWGDQALTQERPLVVISKLLEDYRSQTDRQTDTQTDRQADSQPLTWYIINVLKFTFTILLR